MSTTICGHERETLQWALSDPDALNNAEREHKRVWAIGAPLDFSKCVATPKQRAAACILCPAKLAAIIAELLRGHGFRAIALPWTNIDSDSEPLSIRVAWACPDDVDARGQTLLMPQARVFALRLLETPTTTVQDIERMIGDLYVLG